MVVDLHEEWRPVAGTGEWYEVSNRGRVRSRERTIQYSDGRTRRYPPVLLAQQVRPGMPYLGVTMSVRCKNLFRHVHVLVATAFLGEKPFPEAQVRHLDGCPTNNVVTNLQWGTPSENNLDQVRHGTHPEARKSTCIHGHLLAAPNLRARKPTTVADDSTRRGCKACHRASAKASMARRLGQEFDERAAADWHYARIMGQRHETLQATGYDPIVRARTDAERWDSHR